MITRRAFLAGAAATLAAPAFAAKTSQPNIVFFYSDDQSWGDLGCFGNETINTPNIDRLAREGMKLTQHYAAAPICTPARSALLTGRYPQRNGLFENIRNNMTNYKHEYGELEYIFSPEMTQGLDTREVTFGEVLQSAGYRTGIVGKWDSGRAEQYLPLQRGFDYFYGFCNTGIDYYTHERYGVPSMYRNNRRIKDEGYATDLFAREALRFIDESADDPFFLFMPFNAPHGASNLEYRGAQAPDAYVDQYADTSDERDRRYFASITAMDDAIGQVLDRLEEHGVADNTLVVFTTDHGKRKDAPFRGGKSHMYEGGLRTPCVVRWPGHIEPESESHAMTSAMDWFPTFAEIANATPKGDIHLDGKSMMSVLSGETSDHHETLYWELRAKRAVRRGKWKWVLELKEDWVVPEGARASLYDLEQDPTERNDVADEFPEVHAELTKAWDTWFNEMAASPPRGPFSKAYYDLLGYGDGAYRLP